MLVLHRAPTEVVITDLSKVIAVEKNSVGITEISILGQTSVLVRESVTAVKKMLREYHTKQVEIRRDREAKEKEMLGRGFKSKDRVEEETAA